MLSSILRKFNLYRLICFLLISPQPGFAVVTLGVDHLLSSQYLPLLQGKRIGLIINHTSINSQMERTTTLMKEAAKRYPFTLAALFVPEHGLNGSSFAYSKIQDGRDPDGIPIFSLHGDTRKPTQEMLALVDTLIYDIQDIGSRSYTYMSTLFYAMEEAAKNNVQVIVLDRPNPINGVTIDGPMMEKKWRSFVGYIDVPYCHGMTPGELAQFFNNEYAIGCRLEVIPMTGWEREMTFEDTGLPWIPTSPHVPEAATAWFYPTTGILGELSFVSVGGGSHLPYKVVGAPWINADAFAEALNAQRFPGVLFHPFHFQPLYGGFAKTECHGVIIIITDRSTYLPVKTQYLLIGMLKSLYPSQFREALQKNGNKREMFCKITGNEEIWRILLEEPYILWKLKEIDADKREAFKKKREKYLIPTYIPK